MAFDWWGVFKISRPLFIDLGGVFSLITITLFKIMVRFLKVEVILFEGQGTLFEVDHSF